MSGTKIFFILLVLILIVFIAIEVVGAGKNGSKPAAGYSKCPGSPFCSLSSMSGSFGTKLDLKKKTFNLTQASPHISVAVPPDDTNSFREAAFKFQQGSNCATVSYTSNSVCKPDPPAPDWARHPKTSLQGRATSRSEGPVLMSKQNIRSENGGPDIDSTDWHLLRLFKVPN